MNSLTRSGVLKPDQSGWIGALYDELRRIARGYIHRKGGDESTLGPTGLVNAAVVRLLADPNVRHHHDREYVAAAALRAMRRILAERARQRKQQKRGVGWTRISIDGVLDRLEARRVDFDDLNEAIEQLTIRDARLAEAITLRYFLGMKIDEIARRVGRSHSTVESDLALARAWLHGRLSEKEPAGGNVENPA